MTNTLSVINKKYIKKSILPLYLKAIREKNITEINNIQNEKYKTNDTGQVYIIAYDYVQFKPVLKEIEIEHRDLNGIYIKTQYQQELEDIQKKAKIEMAYISKNYLNKKPNDNIPNKKTTPAVDQSSSTCGKDLINEFLGHRNAIISINSREDEYAIKTKIRRNPVKVRALDDIENDIINIIDHFDSENKQASKDSQILDIETILTEINSASHVSKKTVETLGTTKKRDYYNLLRQYKLMDEIIGKLFHEWEKFNIDYNNPDNKGEIILFDAVNKDVVKFQKKKLLMVNKVLNVISYLLEYPADNDVFKLEYLTKEKIEELTMKIRQEMG